MSILAFYPATLKALRELELINDLQHDRLSKLTVQDLRDRNGVLPEDFAGPITPFINRRLDLMREKGRDAAVAAYLENMVKFWREKRDKFPVPDKFMEVWNKLAPEQQQTFMAVFYVDAFQAVHDSLFDSLVPEDTDE